MLFRSPELAKDYETTDRQGVRAPLLLPAVAVAAGVGLGVGTALAQAPLINCEGLQLCANQGGRDDRRGQDDECGGGRCGQAYRTVCPSCCRSALKTVAGKIIAAVLGLLAIILTATFGIDLPSLTSIQHVPQAPSANFTHHDVDNVFQIIVHALHALADE